MRSTKYSPTPAFTSELVPLPGTKYLDFQIIISCPCEMGIYKRKFEDQEKRKRQEKKKINFKIRIIPETNSKKGESPEFWS